MHHADICTTLIYAPRHQNHTNVISGALSYGHPHVLRCINKSLSKQILSDSKSHSIQKRNSALNTIDLRAQPDALAKIHFLGHIFPAKSYLVQPISLNKPKYHGKEF